MRKLTRIIAGVIALAVAGASLAGCAPSAGKSTTDSSGGGYPMTLANPWGEATIEQQPKRVAVVDSVDLDIALALGVEPVITSAYGKNPLDPWTQDVVDELGITLKTYDSTDGTDFVAIAAAEPDAILATSGWTLEDDYPKLAEIAPVIAWGPDQNLADLTWADRTLLAGKALGLGKRAEKVVADVERGFSDAAAAHPAWAGKTLTYAVMHPSQISYVTYRGSDVTFFTDLGFALPKTAATFSDGKNAVSVENIDHLDADVLLVGYPFGDEGILTKDALERNPLFQRLGAVERKHYGILGDDVASPLAYPTPLSHPWVLERLVPQLAQLIG